MVDVTHDGDDRWTRLELFRRIGDGLGAHVRRVFLFTNRLKTEFAGDELDLIEIETLIDGHHQSKILECKTYDLGCADFENLRELTDCDELIDANCFLFALSCSRALRLELFSTLTVRAARATTAHNALTKRSHRAGYARCYCFLIDGTSLSLAAAS